MFCCWQVSWLKSLESYSSAFDRMNEQEEAGFWCRVVEGIDAEVEAASFAARCDIQRCRTRSGAAPKPRGRGLSIKWRGGAAFAGRDPTC